MSNLEQRQFGRAKNSVLHFLQKKLGIPRIFVDSTWDSCPVDVLAIDSDGSGDVHAALLYSRPYGPEGELCEEFEQERRQELAQRFLTIPANWKYIVAVESNPHVGSRPLRMTESEAEALYAPDGMGRVGLMLVDFLIEADAQTRVVIKAERFRAKIAPIADQFLLHNTADWQYREAVLSDQI